MPAPQSYTGPRTRLRRVVADMLAGQPVEVAVMGGSVSAGAIASRKMAAENPNDVWSLVRLQLQRFVSPRVEFVNNARSATKSYINRRAARGGAGRRAAGAGAPHCRAARALL